MVSKKTNEYQIKNFILNFGPQHPASHGVLRLVVQLNGELIEKVDPHIGFLHRGTEKLIESRTFLKALPYFDRLDYVSMMAQEHAFCLGVEALLQTESKTSPHVFIRVIFDELTRVLNHLLAISTHSLDVGNMSPVFWAFEERERIMEFYERVSGARMHAAFYRPNTLDWTGLNQGLFIDIILFIKQSFKSLTEIFSVLATNRIWKARLVNIGALNWNDFINFGLSGPMARSIGIRKDLRFNSNTSYAAYWLINGTSFLGRRGDCYDRFLIRIREMFESFTIIVQLLANTQTSLNSWIFLNNQKTLKKSKATSMEELINHFKLITDGLAPQKGVTYKAIEAPKGELGVTLVSDGSRFPYRCKIRTPAYHHLQIMNRMGHGHFFADLVTILGSQDIVFGDVDR